MSRPLLFFRQSDYLIQVVDTNSHSNWQTVQIQIRSQLIWIFTTCKSRIYLGSAGLGLRRPKFMFQILDIMDWYTANLLDNMMADPPAWFQSFILCETVLQMPFFFVAAYAFWKGNRTEQCNLSTTANLEEPSNWLLKEWDCFRELKYIVD